MENMENNYGFFRTGPAPRPKPRTGFPEPPPKGEKSPILKIFPHFFPHSVFSPISPPFVIFTECHEKLPKNARKCVNFKKFSIRF